MSKIFGIGLSRSGTSSLTEALKTLGYSAVHFPTSLDQVRRHDAATDTTIADNFERLDQFFPGSKFIYTIRAKEPWLKSCERFWLLMQPRFDGSFFLTELHKQLYGTPTFDRAKFSEAYDRHRERVQRFFLARPNDLLETSFDATPNPWDPLCHFLRKTPPRQVFPHSHEMSLIESCIGRLMLHFNDADLVAQLVNTSPAYVKTIGADAKAVVANRNPVGSGLVQDIAARTGQRVGSARRAAKILGLTESFVRDALAARRRAPNWYQRARSWLER